MSPAFIKEKLGELFEFLKSGAGMLVLSTIAANFINFGFNAYLGRHVDLDDYGIIAIVNTFAYLLTLFTSTLSTTINHTVSRLEGESLGKGSHFLRSKWLHIFLTALAGTVIWLFAVPMVADFFKISNFIVIASFAPAIFFGALGSFNKGYLQGTFSFGMLALISLLEVTSKLALAVLFVHYNLNEFASLAIPASIIFVWGGSMLAVVFIYKKVPAKQHVVTEKKNFPFGFYAASLMSGISVAAFLSIDVILAKHFLSPDDAGRYGLISLVGKMIYFFGSLLNMFIVTVVSRAIGEGRSPRKEFYRIFAGTTFLTIGAGLGLILFGSFLVPFLLGPQAVSIVPYLSLYSLSMMLFTLSTTIVLYQLARKHYVFPALSLTVSALLVLIISQYHDSVDTFVHVIAIINIVYFVVITATHFLYSQLTYTYRNIKDILGVFQTLPEAKKAEAGQKNILIYNWRDTKNIFAGGAETYVQSLASRWVKDGHSVTLFTSNDGHLPPNGETDGVRIIRRGGFYGVYALAALYYMFHFRGGFDVIVDSENGIPFFTPLYAKEPVYCLVHHIHQEVFRKALAWPLSTFASFLEKDFMPLVYRKCNFITVSESSRREMEALNITDKDIQVVHPGIDTDFLTPGPKATIPTVSYIGRLKEHKSVDVLLKAFKDVLASVPTARLIIAGDGEEEKRLIRLSQELDVAKSTSFLGKISEEKKRQIMRESWVFVNPSMMEGWGITTIEANACGTAVVASDVPGLRDSVRDGETGLLAQYGCVSMFAEKINSILKDEKLRSMLSSKAIDWSLNFGWQKSTEKFIHIISTKEKELSLSKVPASQNI